MTVERSISKTSWPSSMHTIDLAIKRMVHNVSVAHGISRDRAIFALETALQKLKRTPPPEKDPPHGQIAKVA